MNNSKKGRGEKRRREGEDGINDSDVAEGTNSTEEQVQLRWGDYKGKQEQKELGC